MSTNTDVYVYGDDSAVGVRSEPPPDGLRATSCRSGARNNGGLPDNDIPSREDPKTWQHSRWSAVGWGIHCRGFLPCNPTRCRYAERRGCSNPPGSGASCPFEVDLCRERVGAYSREFPRARGVLGDEVTLSLLRELALLDVRMLRVKIRMNWLELNIQELMRDPDTVEKETRLTFKYETTLRNRWLEIVERLREANKDPRADWPHIFYVQYVMTGIGPACDLKTREVNYDHHCAHEVETKTAPRWPYTDDPDWRSKF